MHIHKIFFKSLELYVFILAISIPAIAQDKANPLLNNGLAFLGIPYVAHTLDGDTVQEKLIINCDEVDCTTFVEYALAMTLTQVCHKNPNENDFANNLQKIRYRNGIIDGYTSRLHYITDWIENGIRQGFLTDVSSEHSSCKTQIQISYMSSHPEQYKQLVHSPQNVAKMQKIEKKLSEKEIHYIPKEKLCMNGLPWIKDGDIIAITTNITGLDISHLGIACYKKGKLHLLHASSSAQKVVLSSTTLQQMMNNIKSWTGIRVIRMKT